MTMRHKQDSFWEFVVNDPDFELTTRGNVQDEYHYEITNHGSLYLLLYEDAQQGRIYQDDEYNLWLLRQDINMLVPVEKGEDGLYVPARKYTRRNSDEH